MAWPFTYWLFLASLDISVALFDLQESRPGLQVLREVVPRGEGTCLRSRKEVVGFLTLRPDCASVGFALDPPALTSLLSLIGPAGPAHHAWTYARLEQRP